MTTPPDPQPAPPATGTDHERIASIEAEQHRQGTVLDKLVSLAEGKPADPAAEPVTTATGPPPDIAAQMEAAIRKVNAEKPPPAAAAPEPEKPPREPGKKRDRAARVMFGKVADR
jgi:hypothetical protein